MAANPIFGCAELKLHRQVFAEHLVEHISQARPSNS